jgi:hypothetical protein
MGMSDYIEHQIEMVMRNLKCDEDEAIEALKSATNFTEVLRVMGLATERGGDITRRPNWRDEL